MDLEQGAMMVVMSVTVYVSVTIVFNKIGTLLGIYAVVVEIVDIVRVSVTVQVWSMVVGT